MPFFGAREQKILEEAVGRAPSAERTIGLFTSAPTKGENDTELKTKEVAYTGYARVAAAGGTTWWNAATGSAPALITNAKVITFGTWTAGADQKATHFAIFEGGTTPVAFGALEATVTIGAGNTIASFAVGTLEATLT